MFKLLRFYLPLFLTVFVLTGCRKQPPTPVTDGGLGNNAQYQNGTDLIPADMNSGEWGVGDGLEPRDSDAGIDMSNNTYNGRPMVRGILQNVYFGFDSASISASERSKLQEAADHLAANTNDAILIEGYCDWYGTEDYNLALGDRRANSARDYLQTLGVSATRIETLSKGSLEATTGLSKAESGQDRRDELIILK
jgi:peptidoglycan-associated lipoprotein